MPKKIYIHCDGGFGNRFNSLTVGLMIAEKGGFDPVILWPSTNWCRSTFNTIFKNEYEVIEQDLSYFEKAEDYLFLSHGQFTISAPVKHPSSFGSLSELMDYIKIEGSNKDNIVYNHDAIPKYAYGEGGSLQRIVKSLEFTEGITSRTEVFLQHYNEEFSGIHLRNTDFYGPDKPKYDKLEEMVKDNPDTHYFICSDDQELEERFTAHANAFAFPKNKYVEKLTDDGHWRATIEGPDGEEYAFNIERSDESVIEAMVDLLVLSKSTIIPTSESTFLKTAQLIQDSNAR